MFEKRTEALLPRSKFFLRLVKFTLIAIGIIIFSLFIGVLGYMQTEHLSLIDAFLNAAMLMGGMGPVNVLHSESAKLFAGVYALYCGFIVLVCVGLFFTPIFHRILHRSTLKVNKKETEIFPRHPLRKGYLKKDVFYSQSSRICI